MKHGNHRLQMERHAELPGKTANDLVKVLQPLDELSFLSRYHTEMRCYETKPVGELINLLNHLAWQQRFG